MYICENELMHLFDEVSDKLSLQGFETEIALVRDYLMKIMVLENGNKLGKLIIDYSPKKKSHSFRKDSDLSEQQFNRILSIIHGQLVMDIGFDEDITREGENSGYEAYVDGSFIDGSIGFGSVILKDNRIIQELYGRVDDPEAFSARQVGGEIKAVIETLEWCKQNGVNEITLYFDFLNIEKWATGAYRTNTPMTQAYKQYIDSCNIRITWQKVESHTGIPLNDRADELAKMGARLYASQDKSIEEEGSTDPLSDEPLYGWIVYNGNLNSPKFYEQVDWLVKAAGDNGIILDAVKNDDLAACVIDGKAEVKGFYERWPQFVLFWDKDVRLARQLERLGLRLFNSSRAIAVCDDKTLTHQMLSNLNIPMPVTIYAPLIFPGCPFDEERFIERIEPILSYPIIVKEAFGSFGAQVYMAKNRQELKDLRQSLVYKPHLYQEYIRTSHGRDVRLQVVGGKVVASMLRTSETDFRANLSAGGKMQSFNPPEAFIALAVKAAKQVGADFAGVDILFGENDSPILCEINSNAHMKNIFDCTGVDVAERVVKYIKEQMTLQNIKGK